jgi:hypothetical protein
MDLCHRGQAARFLTHDRDTKFSRDFGAVSDGEGMSVVLSTERERPS